MGKLDGKVKVKRQPKVMRASVGKHVDFAEVRKLHAQRSEQLVHSAMDPVRVVGVSSEATTQVSVLQESVAELHHETQAINT